MKTALPAALTSFIPWKQLTALTSSWNMELLTIASMAVVVIIMWIQSFGWGEHGLDIEEKFWLLKARTGEGGGSSGRGGVWTRYRERISEVLLGRDKYFVGNRLWDDIYVRTSGKRRIRCYLNVQKDQIILTVMRGHIVLGRRRYEADSKKRIRLSEFSDVLMMDGVEIVFQKLQEKITG